MSGDLDSTLAGPHLDETLSITDRLSAICAVFDSPQTSDDERSVVVFDVKEQYKLLCSICGVSTQVQFLDPKVACWLLDPSAKEKNLHSMVTNYCPTETHLLEGTGTSKQPLC